MVCSFSCVDPRHGIEAGGERNEKEGEEVSRFKTLNAEISSKQHREIRASSRLLEAMTRLLYFFSCIRHAGMQKTKTKAKAKTKTKTKPNPN